MEVLNAENNLRDINESLESIKQLSKDLTNSVNNIISSTIKNYVKETVSMIEKEKEYWENFYNEEKINQNWKHNELEMSLLKLDPIKLPQSPKNKETETNFEKKKILLKICSKIKFLIMKVKFQKSIIRIFLKK